MRYHVGPTDDKARSPYCQVSSCASRRCHRYLEDGQRLVFPYCSHRKSTETAPPSRMKLTMNADSCFALKGDTACFEMTQYDEDYCRGRKSIQPIRSRRRMLTR